MAKDLDMLHKARFEEHRLELGSLFIFRLPNVKISILSLIQAYMWGYLFSFVLLF